MEAETLNTGVFAKFTDIAYANLPERAAAAKLPNHERQRRVETMLVPTRAFKVASNQLQSFHRPVADGTIGRGMIGGCLGESRAGKSTAIRAYAEKLGHITTNEAIVPTVVYVQPILGWTSLDFAVGIAKKLLPGQIKRRNAESIFEIVIEEIKHHGVELVVIDDAQFLLGSHFHRTVQEMLGFIIALAEANCCNVLLTGTPVIQKVIERSDHAFRRGSFPHWQINAHDWSDPKSREQFCFLLDDIDERLPFEKPSNLLDPDLAAHFYYLSGGLIGLVMNYVKAAAYLAINDGSACISRKHLVEAAATRRKLNDSYMPFHRRLSDEEVARGGEAEKVDPDENSSHGWSPSLTKRRKSRSGIA